MRIGLDIEKISRFELPKESAFIKKTFLNSEINYAYSKTEPARHLCGIFCAKEAVKKALRRPISWLDIEIRHKKDGEPFVKIKNKISQFPLSISHCQEYSVASAINLEK